jgi:hypothetical protein
MTVRKPVEINGDDNIGVYWKENKRNGFSWFKVGSNSEFLWIE